MTTRPDIDRRAPCAALVLGCSCALAFGCGGDPEPLAWSFELADPETRERAVVVRTRILAGGCESVDETTFESFLRADAMTSAAPPALDPGRYGFDGLATDAMCNIVASGCVERTLPGPSSVVVELETVTPPRALCAASACDTGICAGGVRDAGPDLGPPPMDAGPPDLGPRDAGPPDTGPDLGVDAGSPRIPIARVQKIFAIGGTNYLRVAFSANPGDPGEPEGAAIPADYFWALPPNDDPDEPCPPATTPLAAYYAPDSMDARQVFYTPGGAPPAGYTVVPTFACVPVSASADTVDVRQLSHPGYPAAEYFYTSDPTEVAEAVAMRGYDDDGIAFRGWRAP